MYPRPQAQAFQVEKSAGSGNKPCPLPSLTDKFTKVPGVPARGTILLRTKIFARRANFFWGVSWLSRASAEFSRGWWKSPKFRRSVFGGVLGIGLPRTGASFFGCGFAAIRARHSDGRRNICSRTGLCVPSVVPNVVPRVVCRGHETFPSLPWPEGSGFMGSRR